MSFLKGTNFWIFKHFLLSRIVMILIIIFTFKSLIFESVGKQENTDFVIYQYEKQFLNNTVELIEDVEIFDKNELSRFLNGVSDFELKFLKIISLLHNYDSHHYIHVAINNYSTKKNLAFLPLFPIYIKFNTDLFTKFVYSFKLDIANYLFTGLLLSNFIFILNLFIFKVFLERIFDVNRGISIIKWSIWLYLYNPGTIFFLSIYTENICFSIHITSLIHLLNYTEESFFTFNNIFTFSCIFFVGIGIKTNMVLMCIYMLIPIIMQIHLYMKTRSERFEDSEFYYNFSLFKNLSLCFKCFFENKIKLLKILFVIITCYLSFVFFTKLLPSNTICDSLYAKIKNFRKEEIEINANSTFKMMNNTIFLSENSNTYYDLSKDLLYYYCKNEHDENLYSDVQKEFWKTGFLLQFYEFPKNLDRLFFSLLTFLVSLYFVKHIFSRVVSFKNLLNLNIIDSFDVYSNSMKYKSSLMEIFKKIKKEADKTNLENQMKYSELYFDKILLLKVILFSSAIYQLLLMIVIILFAHWQIANRLLTCNPLLYIYLAQLFSEHFDKEVLNLKLRNVEFIENIKRENENKNKTKSNDDSKCSNLECNHQPKQDVNNLNKISTANNTIDEFDERTPSLKNKVHEHNHNCYHEHCLKNSNNNEDSKKMNINDQNNSHKCNPENTLKYSAYEFIEMSKDRVYSNSLMNVMLKFCWILMSIIGTILFTGSYGYA